jgi:NAD(P)-dependent dehydrogenase (short-subunit alcohol dehydrogenase family)
VGVFGGKDFADITDEDWISVFEINVMSGIRMSRALFPKMLEKITMAVSYL